MVQALRTVRESSRDQATFPRGKADTSAVVAQQLGKFDYITYLFLDYNMKLAYGFTMLIQRGVQPIPWAARADIKGADLCSCSNKAAMAAETSKARAERKVRLHLFPVLVLFRPVIGGEPERPDRRRAPPNSCFHAVAYGKISGARLCPPACFSPVIYRQTGLDCLILGVHSSLDRTARRGGPRYSNSSRNGSAS